MTKKLKKTKKKIIKLTQKKQGRKESDKANKIIHSMKRTKISVIGVGGGGGSIISEIASNLSGASFIAANTDTQALETIGKNVKSFSFGQKLTQGLGTGMNVNLAKEAAQDEKERIKKLCQDQDLCIIIASLGGGTGSGATSIFTKMSKSLGNLTYGIFTLPFEFEGERKMEIAKEALKKIKPNLDIITIIPNERVFQIINKDTPLKEALSIINKSLAKNLEGLIKTIYEPGLINIDFADFKTIFKNKGKLAYLNTVEVSAKENLVKNLMTQIFNSPLYPYNIRGAKGILFNISGEKNLSLSEVSEISKNISDLANTEAKIIFGTRIFTGKKNIEPTIKTTLLAIGCGETEKVNKIEKSKKVIRKPKVKKLVKPLKDKLVFKKTSTKIKINTNSADKLEERRRKNGVQIKRDAEDFEKEILEKEKAWEVPAFLRRDQ